MGRPRRAASTVLTHTAADHRSSPVQRAGVVGLSGRDINLQIVQQPAMKPLNFRVMMGYELDQRKGEATEPQSRWSRPMTIGALTFPVRTSSLKARPTFARSP